MQLILFNAIIAATHADTQEVSGLYPGALVLTIPDSTPVAIGQSWEVDLDAAKTAACAAIDAQAERLRNAVLTPGSGQMAAYQAKEAQAAALLQDPTPTEAEYPDIFNEIGITADSAAAVASAVLTAAETWRAYGRQVEKARLAGKKAIGQATDGAGIVAARDGIVWPGLRSTAP